MSCSDWTDYQNALADMAIRDAMLCPLQDAVGGPQLALLMFGAVAMVYTITQKSFVMTYVIAVIMGGAILSEVAPIGVTIAGIIVLLMLGGLPTLYLKRRLAQ